jgi:hypothetical protein
MLVIGPLIAFGVVAALAAVLRWAFNSPDLTRTEDVVFATARDDDFGLLSIAGLVDTTDEAHTLQELLAGAGIRATTAAGRDGRIRVLVFASELSAARRVVGGPA